MSVNTSEEYLDELLQAIEPIIYMNQPEPEPQVVESPVVEELDDTNGLLDNPVEIPVEAPAFSEVEEINLSDDDNGLADLLSEELLGTEVQESAPDVAMDNLLAALASEEPVVEEEAFDIDAMLNAAAGSAESMPDSSIDHDADVKALLQQFTDDEDLSDIGEILDRNDNNEAVDESVLQTPDVEVFQMEENAEAEEEKKKESKGLFGFLKKKKDKKDKKNKKQTDEELLVEDNSVGDTVELTEDSSVEIMPEMDFLADFGGGDSQVEEIMGESDLSSMSLDDIFAEGDMTDIDALLSAGSFDETGVPTMANGGEQDSIEGKSGKKKGKGDKKESFFSRVFTMLTEEDEEETPKKGAVPEASATGITDENETILEELSKEEKKKRKKEEKEQKKKEKEAKKKGKTASEGEETEEGEAEEDKKKKKKKVKKEKPRKVIDIDEKPPKKLSKKKVSVVFVLCFSILAMILILQAVLLDLSNIKEARWAFDNADYETCYANLYGEELSEEDEAIFQKSYIILCVQRKWDSYENFKQIGMEVEALNALFDGVRVYRNMTDQAESYGILSRITPIFEMIYSELKGYGLSDTDIEEILAYESKVSYTKRLESIVNGTPFVMNEWITKTGTEDVIEVEDQAKPLEDVLPMEEDFLPDDTSLVNEMNQMDEGQVQTESEVGVPVIQEQGNTVVVGSAPVDINGTTQDASTLGGTNVGSGSTNISAEVNGNTVFVN